MLVRSIRWWIRVPNQLSTPMITRIATVVTSDLVPFWVVRFLASAARKSLFRKAEPITKRAMQAKPA
ncbi:hypothetical protein D3C72_2521520 [compost metagenome]